MLTLIPPSSGSIQGVTYSHNRGGAYTRKRATPVVGTRTTRQGVVKGNMTVASQAWQLLSPADQASWISYANGHPVINRLGSSIKLTGSQYFIKCAAALLNAGQPLPTLPPTSTTIQPVVVATYAVTDTPDMLVEFTPGTAGDFILVAVAKWTSLGVNFQKTYSQVGVIGSDAADADFIDEWVAFAGNPVVGNKAWIRLTPVNAGGLTGSPIYQQVPVVAATGIATPVGTSPSAATVVMTWSGSPTSATLEIQSGPSAVGPWTTAFTLAAVTSPQTKGATTGQYNRGRLITTGTGIPGPWSNSILIT